MNTTVAGFFAAHRKGISRVVALALVALLLSLESKQKGTIVAASLFLFGVILIGAAIAGRLWCALYISGKKNQEVVMDGPYSVTRNPLYFFSFLGFVGIGFCTETFTVGFAAIGLFALVYPFVIANEENFLRAKFGQAFIAYCERTPRFFPKLKLYREPESYLADTRRFRQAISEVIWFAWLIGLVRFSTALHECGILEPLIRLP